VDATPDALVARTRHAHPLCGDPDLPVDLGYRPSVLREPVDDGEQPLR